MPTVSTPVRSPWAEYQITYDTRSASPSIGADAHGLATPWGGAADVKSGTKNPGWRDRIAKHIDASSAYTRTVFTEVTPAVIVGRTRTLKAGYTSGYIIESFARNESLLGSMVPVSGTDSSLQNTALTRLKNRLRQQTSAANVMAPIAELGELRGLIHTAIHFTTDTIEALLQLRRGSTRKVNKLWKDLWLSYNFGIRPLIKDIADAGAAIAAFIARQDLTYRIHGSASREGMYNYEPTYASITAIPVGTKVTGAGTCNYTLRYRYVGAFHATLRSANDYSVFDSLGINLESIPSTLWELTAFSWIADYFGNIGKYLEDRFYCPPGNLVYLNLTRTYEATLHNFASYVMIPGNPNNVEITHSHSGVSTVRYKEVDRSVLASLPHIALDFYSLDTIGQHALSKLLNLVAVVRPRSHA